MVDKANATQNEHSTDIDLGNYDVIHQRLVQQARRLAEHAEQLNKNRQQNFGGTELERIGRERVRTEHNCVLRDIVNVKGNLLLGYNVFMGLKTETSVRDIFSLHGFATTPEGFDLAEIDISAVDGFLVDARFQRDFKELREYYKDSKLQQLRVNDGYLLAVFQISTSSPDIKVFRWTFDSQGQITYVDNRGERDHVFPPAHDFTWQETTPENYVRGRHPHVNILNEVFVETVGGDLTIKVENNTESGEGVYAELVDDPNQSLDDAPFHYAKLGALILLKVTPYRESITRHFIFNTRTAEAVRQDAIGQACVQLPEDHGIIFPGGYYLQTGDYKVFDADTTGLRFKRAIRSPNGEDVLYVFHREHEGTYFLYPYNLVRKEIQTPIVGNGYSIFEDGKMIVFRNTSDEPTRTHNVQVWQTPFVSAEEAARQPNRGGFLAKIGNADLVRGISDAFTVQRMVQAAKPSRRTFEDLIAFTNRVLDTYDWLGHPEIAFRDSLLEIRRTTEQVIDEFEKVLRLAQAAAQALAAAQESQRTLLRGLDPTQWNQIDRFLETMTALRNQRGHLITLREVRNIDRDALDKLERELVGYADNVGKACVQFLLAGQAFTPLRKQIDALGADLDQIQKANKLKAPAEKLDTLAQGLQLLIEVINGLEMPDPTLRTQILEQVAEVFSQINRVRALITSRHQQLLSLENRAEFAAHFKLFGQSVQSSLALCDTPQRCDEELTRLLLQLEDLEARFGELHEFTADLALKRDEVRDAITARKQSLVDERNRRATNLMSAAKRILEGAQRRLKAIQTEDELNAYYAADPMIHKLHQVAQHLEDIDDTLKAEEVRSQAKKLRQDALRTLRDRRDLYEEGQALIKLGRHRFAVNTQPIEVSMVPREHEGQTTMAIHINGTEFYAPVEDQDFARTLPFWGHNIISESDQVYRAEFLCAEIIAAAEERRQGLSLESLSAAMAAPEGLLGLVREFAANRFDEAYERGVHDHDTALILDKVLTMRHGAGLLRYPPQSRAWAALFWAYASPDFPKEQVHRHALSLFRLRQSFANRPEHQRFVNQLSQHLEHFFQDAALQADAQQRNLAAWYLFEQIGSAQQPRFPISSDAQRLGAAFLDYLRTSAQQQAFDDDLAALSAQPATQFSVARAWLDAFAANHPEQPRDATDEATLVMLARDRLTMEVSSARLQTEVQGLIGNHHRIVNRTLTLRLDDFYQRLERFRQEWVPGYRSYRQLRTKLLQRFRERVRLDDFAPNVMTSFVRNRLINDVYLPLIGNNLAKQIGAAGEGKRTDLMGLLLLISPPGYGKTTLMEYVGNRLGFIFMKINGPALGHAVRSLDPAEAPNATARQEVEKINLALEMGNNVMLYLDDIQHTHPELLQKFISLCDAQRKIEGVFQGRTKTYDFRGKKFCVVMAGNPYTEAGEKFQIPDMLANRADTYNLGDILQGRDDLFALSYIENALTSNQVLAPLATRDSNDIYKLIAMAQGEDVASTDLVHGYSSVEIAEIVTIFKHLFHIQAQLLQVNLAYIASASMDDAYRTEPRFQLQGSYRNMNKITEKVVAAMTPQEVQSLIDEHYTAEAQTLTNGAEANLLKLRELTHQLTPQQQTRWEQIKNDFRRIKVMGGKEDDPVARVSGAISQIGDEIVNLRQGMQNSLPQALQSLTGMVNELANPQIALNVTTPPPAGIEELLAQQVAIIERTLIPIVRTATQNSGDQDALQAKLREVLDYLRHIDTALRDGGWTWLDTPTK